MNAQRGDVVLVMFPDSNLRTAKRRPALVVQSDQLQAGLPQTIVAMITSNMSRAGHPSRQPVSAKSPAGGVTKPFSERFLYPGFGEVDNFRLQLPGF